MFPIQTARHSCLIQSGIITILLLSVPLAEGQDRRAKQLESYQKQYQDVVDAYHRELKQLAGTAREAGFPQDAQAILDLAVPFDPAKIQANSLPRTVQADLPVQLAPPERWRLTLRKLREDHAVDLYLLSRRLLHAKFPSAAYRLIREVLIANPDHQLARKILGYQRLGDEWITRFEAKQRLKNNVWHDQFGWIPKTRVDLYENGKRFFRNRWITAEQENEIRRDFQNAWVIPTEHFIVKTNHSLERGVEVAKTLEDYYDFFTQTFVGFFYSPDQLTKLFNSASQPGRARQAPQFVVHYYRTRDEYNQNLVRKVPQIALTNGLYHNGDRIAYFYHDPRENNDSTLFHEATHQLLFETRFTPQNARMVGDDANFWIIEGIACYMESLVLGKDQQTLGDPKFKRFYWARQRYLKENYYVPFAQFTAMGMREFQMQQPENLSRNYSQSSGLVHFLMHYEGGIYREALVEHLSQIYSTRRRFQPVQSLAELTETPFSELDGQYKAYLRKQQLGLQSEQPLLPSQ